MYLYEEQLAHKLRRNERNSTRIGILVVILSASAAIYILYMYSIEITNSVHHHRNMNTNNNVFKSAQLIGQSISDHVIKLIDQVEIEEKKVTARGMKIFYRHLKPPGNNYAKADILLLHGQAFTSANWLEKQTLQTFAAAGYRCIAVDLPGYGQTGGKTIPNEFKPQMLRELFKQLELDRPILISPSMSGAYAVPLFMQWPQLLKAFVAIAPVNTADYTQEMYEHNTLPTLIIYGERDTSLGVLSASNMKHLPNGRVMKIVNAGHACYLNNPELFNTACLNFFDLVRTHSG